MSAPPFFVQRYTAEFLRSSAASREESLLELAVTATRNLLTLDWREDDWHYTFPCPGCGQNTEFETGGEDENRHGDSERGKCFVVCCSCNAFFITAEPTCSQSPTTLVAAMLPGGDIECRTKLLLITGVVFGDTRGFWMCRESPESANEQELAKLDEFMAKQRQAYDRLDFDFTVDDADDLWEDAVIRYHPPSHDFMLLELDPRLCYACDSYNASRPKKPYPAWCSKNQVLTDNNLFLLEGGLSIETRGA
jgi:hypothetical protein